MSPTDAGSDPEMELPVNTSRLQGKNDRIRILIP
jgi:hypothetical protein